MRVVVATIVHHPDDARIRYRQIAALLNAGIDVTYIAPAGDRYEDPRIRRIEVPRASGRRRLGALRAARNALEAESPDSDVTLIHDPELILAHGSIHGPRVWDIHEDVVNQLGDKAYIPAPARALARTAAKALERLGSRRFERLIAERAYADRHPDAVLVRNTVRPIVDPEPSRSGRAVYLGRVSTGRGLDSLNIIAAGLPRSITLEVIGPADAGMSITDRAVVRGFVPNDQALHLLGGATVGLSLLRDLPNYRHSLPTKVLEYLAAGVPVITTPLAEAVEIVERYDCGIIVPFDEPTAVIDAIVALDCDDDNRARLAHNGHAAVRNHFNWSHDAAVFVEHLRAVAERDNRAARNSSGPGAAPPTLR